MLLRKKRLIVFFVDIVISVIFSIPRAFELLFFRYESSSPENILLIELWGIGDLVMLSPLLEVLRNKFPKSKISLLCREHGRIIFDSNPYLDEIIAFDFPWTSFREKYVIWKWDWSEIYCILKQLRAKDFDLALSARGDLRDNLLGFLSKAKRRIGYSWLGGKFFLTENLSNEYENKHRVQAWLNIADFLGAKTEKIKPSLFLSKQDQKIASEFFLANGILDKDFVIGIHPGAGIKRRCWPLERFAKIAEYVRDNHQAKIVVFVEPDGYGENIPITGSWIKADLPLKEIMAVVNRLDLFIGNDSGVMHIANALDIAGISIFGPGDSKIVGPYRKERSIIIEDPVTCRPCFDNCKYNDFRCLNQIKVEKVIRAIDDLFLMF